MEDPIVMLAKKFITMQSTSDNPKVLSDILDLALLQLGEYTIERFERNGVKTALVYNTKKRPKKFKIILNGHLDIIPGKKEQYVPMIKGNKLYGAGSMDMKANAACLITVFKELAGMVTYPLALQLVTDEETGGFDGTKYQIEKGVRADFVIAGEPTNFDIVHKAKGIFMARISTKGKSAHGAYPWRGENAIWNIYDFLTLLKKRYPIPKVQKWITTVNVSRIETSNRAFNKIPDDCLVEFDMRFIPEDDDSIVKTVKRLLPKGLSMEILANEPALFTDRNNIYVKLLEKIDKQIVKKEISLRGAQGSSDARHFAHVNGTGIEFGPIGGGIGSDEEWVDIPSLETYCQILRKFLLSV